MKVLVLGFGSAGRRHVEHLKALNQTVGCYDPKQAALGDFDVRWFATEGLAAKWIPDAVIIASPASEHARQLWSWLPFVDGVFVEKPLGLSVTDVTPRGMYPSEARVQVGYQLRSHDAAKVLKHEVEAGTIGIPHAGYFYTGSHLSTWGGSTYADALLECSHELDAARFVLGGDCELRAAHQNGETWDLMIAHHGPSLYASPVSQVHLSTEEPVYRRTWEVVGERGVLRWDWTAGTVVAEMHHGARHVLWQDDPVDASRRAYRTQLAVFLDAVSGRTAPPCTLEDGLAVLRLCDAARQNIQQNGQTPIYT